MYVNITFIHHRPHYLPTTIDLQPLTTSDLDHCTIVDLYHPTSTTLPPHTSTIIPPAPSLPLTFTTLPPFTYTTLPLLTSTTYLHHPISSSIMWLLAWLMTFNLNNIAVSRRTTYFYQITFNRQ